jgi:pSer/pThr/pTyr-binding forkhead associated (FHA) protein
MIWVEVLSRHRDVVARFRVASDEAHIGRGYDNDVVIDDPYVAARHVHVFRDEAGRLVAEDAGSKNGMFVDRDSARKARIVIDPERPIRIGHTHVRIRESAHAVPLERVAGVRMRAWPAVVIAAGLGVSVLGVEALRAWLLQTGEPRVSTYLTSLLFITALALIWVSVWTILSRIFSGQARFLQNLLIGLSGFLAVSLQRELAQFAAFAFTWPAVISYEYALQWCIVAAACFFHLREAGRSHLVLKGAAVATLLVLAVTVQTVLQSETVSDAGQQATVRRLLPPALRLAPVRAESDFFAEIEHLKTGLDRDRQRAREP